MQAANFKVAGYSYHGNRGIHFQFGGYIMFQAHGRIIIELVNLDNQRAIGPYNAYAVAILLYSVARTRIEVVVANDYRVPVRIPDIKVDLQKGCFFFRQVMINSIDP